jgi:hypothetical protein
VVQQANRHKFVHLRRLRSRGHDGQRRAVSLT